MHKLSSLEIRKSGSMPPKPLKLYPPLELAHVQHFNDDFYDVLLLSYFQQGHSSDLGVNYSVSFKEFARNL
jgi:hypothetical protein